MDILLKGLAFGSILALAIGPVFFSLIQTSIEKGFSSGVFMAFGISLSDVMYVVLSYLGITKLANDPAFKFYVALLGGLVLVSFGVFSFFKKVNISKAKAIKSKNHLADVVKGFLINGVNPFVFIFWVGAMSYATIDYGFSGNEVRTFFLVVLITVFLTDLIKSYLAGKLTLWVTPRLMRRMNYGVGALLVIFGLRLLYSAINGDGLNIAQSIL